MYQSWEHVTFLHWEYDPAVIQRLLPPGLTLDTFGEAAWVGLVPFRVTHLRPPFLRKLPWLGDFPETNVRTYVIGPDGRPGVYFFTLDADRLLAVLGARAGFRLPYRWARMSVDPEQSVVRYRSTRERGFKPAFTNIEVAPGEFIEACEFDKFLTARFTLFTGSHGRTYFADIEHQPWPLLTASVTRLDQDLVQSCGLPAPEGHPVVHFARRVDVLVAPLRCL